MSLVYYVYILQCNDGTKYYGHTNNLRRRLRDHQRGRVYYTRGKGPNLIYFHGYDTNHEAVRQEMKFKNGRTRKETTKKLIDSFDQTKCQGFNSQTALRPMTYVAALRKSSVH